MTEAAWAKGIIDQPLGEPVLAELRDNPINPEVLDPHSRWVEHKIHRVVWRHAFTDHDCQFTGCLSMMIAESVEMRDVLIEAYERGRRDALGQPWKPGEYDAATTPELWCPEHGYGCEPSECPCGHTLRCDCREIANEH